MTDQEGVALHIHTEPDEKGSYSVTISIGEDHALSAGPDEVRQYVTAILTACVTAAHDAAVFQQLKGLLDGDTKAAATIVKQIRQDRPPMPETGTPLSLHPSVNPHGHAFLTVLVDDKECGQWDLEDARNHATRALEATMAADLDSAYYRYLVGPLELEPTLALRAINDMRGTLQ
jgi:hypothetical protein